MAAHLLTGVRLLLVVPSALAFARPDAWGPFWPAAFVSLAIATDHFDGIVARARGSASARGQLFDHSTDCLFVAGSLGGATSAGALPVLLPILVVIAFAQYVIDSYVLERRKQLRMSRLGRWNGIFYFAPLIGVALARLPVPSVVESTLLALTLAISWVLVVSTVVSIVDRALATGAAAPRGCS